MKMKKIIGIMLTLVMVIGLLPGMSLTAYAVDHNHDGWKEWNINNSLPDTADNYYLTSDVTLASTWTVPTGTTSLCLNGHTIKGNPDNDVNDVITIGTGATLKLYDEPENAGMITHDTGKTGRGVHNNGGTFNMYGGTISGNNFSSGHGGGVYNESGTFNLYGGTITNNKAEYGGGVNNFKNFNMSGGTITNNEAEYGGGVYNFSNGEFNMSGGKITNNTATIHGGGLYNAGGEKFNMSGGTISDNIANERGGGVYTNDFKLSGNPTITGNTSNHKKK